MNKDKIQSAINLKVICLVKWIMEQMEVTEDVAYEKLLPMELYRILTDMETGLYLEPIEYIYDCYKIETDQGPEHLLQYVSVL
ncbi:hypothetical protein [Lacrimispora sp.]|uniref:hypothetical protein n=1 Tax=Lacrimispora sp. TaxID=2719234 RepID=UPI003461614A